MPADDAAKADLQHYLQQGREAILWKLEGLSEYDARRPLTPTATHRHAGHAGHADILRESLDGAAGHRVEQDNLAAESDWSRHRARVNAAARSAE